MWHGRGKRALGSPRDVSPNHPNYLGARHQSIHITFTRVGEYLVGADLLTVRLQEVGRSYGGNPRTLTSATGARGERSLRGRRPSLAGRPSDPRAGQAEGPVVLQGTPECDIGSDATELMSAGEFPRFHRGGRALGFSFFQQNEVCF